MTKEDLQDLLTSPGWEALKGILYKRRESAISALVTMTEFNDMVRQQARIKALDELMKLPHELVVEGK